MSKETDHVTRFGREFQNLIAIEKKENLFLNINE